MGDDGPVGSGAGVGEIVGVDCALGEGVGEIAGCGVGLATTFRCHVSLFPDFLQMREPDVELILAHLAPNLAAAP